MDDVLAGADSLLEARAIKRNLNSALNLVGFKLDKPILKKMM